MNTSHENDYGLNKSTTSKLKHLFSTAHYIAVQCRLISDYVSLSKLDRAKGVDIGESYLNRILMRHHVFRFHSTSEATATLE